MPAAEDFPAIPWQVSRHIITKLADARAYQINQACMVINNPKTPPVRIHAFRGDKAAFKDLLAAVLTRFSGTEFFAPAIFPELLGKDVFEPLGFVREPLNQLLMRRDLCPNR